MKIGLGPQEKKLVFLVIMMKYYKVSWAYQKKKCQHNRDWVCWDLNSTHMAGIHLGCQVLVPLEVGLSTKPLDEGVPLKSH